jgi:hypothetical protein
MAHEADVQLEDVVVHVEFEVGPDRATIEIRPPDAGRRFSGDPMLFAESEPLPPEIEFQQVAERAG